MVNLVYGPVGHAWARLTPALARLAMVESPVAESAETSE